jgi:hypothetical protein
MMVTPNTDSGRAALPRSSARHPPAAPCDAGQVRHSEFWQLMDDEFGSGYARTLARGQVIAGLAGRTADEALAAHVAPREVWLAVCDVMDVPAERRWGHNQRRSGQR